MLYLLWSDQHNILDTTYIKIIAQQFHNVNKIKYCMIFVVNKDKVLIKWVTKENCEEYFTTIFLSLLTVYEALDNFNNNGKNIFNLRKY